MDNSDNNEQHAASQSALESSSAKESYNMENLLTTTKGIRDSAVVTDTQLNSLKGSIDLFILAAEDRCSKLGKLSEIFTKFNLQEQHQELDTLLQSIARGLRTTTGYEEVFVSI